MSRFKDKGVYSREEEEPTATSSIDLAMSSMSASIMNQQVPRFANGSWELMTTLIDTAALPIKRFDLGMVRRSINILGSNRTATSRDGMISIDDIAESMSVVATIVGPAGSSTSCMESYPMFWGLASGTAAYSVACVGGNQQLLFKGEALKRDSKSPWKNKGLDSQSVELLYCDEQIMITVERGSTNDKKSSGDTGDLFTLWRRMKEQLWKKY
jgi:hypothetical protein